MTDGERVLTADEVAQRAKRAMLRAANVLADLRQTPELLGPVARSHAWPVGLVEQLAEECRGFLQAVDGLPPDPDRVAAAAWIEAVRQSEALRPEPAPAGSARLEWGGAAGDQAVASDGMTYALQSERVRGESVYYEAWWYPHGDSYAPEAIPGSGSYGPGAKARAKRDAQQHNTRRLQPAHNRAATPPCEPGAESTTV